MEVRTRKLVHMETIKEIINKYDCPHKKELLEDFSKLPIRQTPPPRPKGGIGIREASVKYGVCHPTISKWRTRGLLTTLLVTKNRIYLDEQSIAIMVAKYKQNPGRGKRQHLKIK